MDACGQ